MNRIPAYILDRRSIRKYTGEEVSDKDIRALLEAAMLAPSAVNTQPWHFIVTKDKERIRDLTENYNMHLDFAPEAGCVILVCADINLTFEPTLARVDVDCAAATMNILTAAKALGLGTCWCGVRPDNEVVKNWAGTPENIIPFSAVVIGHPAEDPPRPSRYMAERVHQDKW
jgi:nitroreductase